jgi:Ca2+-binding EF-hand superfamily protein
MSCLKITVAALTMAGILATSGLLYAGTPAEFDKCDKNKDGKLTFEEFKACYPDKAKAREAFNWYDRNKNGVVTKKEFTGSM